MLIEAIRITAVITGGNHTPSVLPSGREAFWDSLPASQKELNGGRLAKLEALSMEKFSQPGTPTRRLPRTALVMALGHPTVQDSTWIAWANALRVLDEPRTEYCLRGFRQGQLPEERLSQFQSVTVRDMLSFLQKLREGAVAIMDWPHSPNHTGKFTIDPTHPRLVTGFTQNEKGLFFHLADPRERVYSFRNLMVACIWDAHVFERGITPHDINEVAERALIIEKRSST